MGRKEESTNKKKKKSKNGGGGGEIARKFRKGLGMAIWRVS